MVDTTKTGSEGRSLKAEDRSRTDGFAALAILALTVVFIVIVVVALV